MSEAIAFAGIAEKNPSLFRRLRVSLGDPAAWFQVGEQRWALVRDIERERVQKAALADTVLVPAEAAPSQGLSADRETATAQALAVAIQRAGANVVRVDRSFPMIYAHELMSAGLEVRYDAELGVIDRRSKSSEELEHLAQAQQVTEAVMEQLCNLISASRADADGSLHDSAGPLTSERLRAWANLLFLDRGYSMTHGAIIVTRPHAADCHHAGAGPLYTGHPVIVDLFPRNEATRYWGDCTRTVVHGQPSAQVLKMHAAVCAAKTAATMQLRAGQTAESVHHAAIRVLTEHGFETSRGVPSAAPTIQHGTGHGIGLDIHEPILLDDGGGVMLLNEVFTVEPGLYGRVDGGVRVEDMLVVTNGEAINLNRLPETLDWKV